MLKSFTRSSNAGARKEARTRNEEKEKEDSPAHLVVPLPLGAHLIALGRGPEGAASERLGALPATAPLQERRANFKIKCKMGLQSEFVEHFSVQTSLVYDTEACCRK